MFKSVSHAVIGLSRTSVLRQYECKCVHFCRPNHWPLFRPHEQFNTNSFVKSPLFVRPTSRHFTRNAVNHGHLDTKLDTIHSKKEDSPNLLTENEASVETLENDTPDLFEGVAFDEITGGNEEALTQFKLLLLEVDVMRQDGMKIPKVMSTDQWKELFALKSRSQRIKMLKFLWTIEMKKISDKRKKEERKAKILEKQSQLDLENANNEHIRYGFQGSTIFVRVYESTMNLHYNNRLVQAMRFGQNVVIDCGYENNMSRIENKLCAKQLGILFADNRKNVEPFNVQFCNMSRDGVVFKHFKKIIPTLDDPQFPINISEEHYLDLFPKEKLVYLTPHCNKELLHFNHDDIYIIGAIVDKQNNDPLSLAKAKSEGIRMAQLPLDRYLQWALGTKSLTINQVLTILLDVRTTGDWNSAFKHVPRRKLRNPDEPIQDTRKYFRRGTTFQPPPSKYERSKKRYFL